MAARTRGSGPDVVLFHGGMGCWRHWTRNIEPLAERFTVHALDHPSYGASASVPRETTGKEYLDLVHRLFLEMLPGDAPLRFAGFSFGAAVGLRAACPHSRVQATIGVGLPVVPAADERTYDFGFLQTCSQPKLFVSGARDQYGPRPKLQELVNSLPEPKKLVLIEGADHFFAGRLRELRDAIEKWVKEVVAI